MNAARAAALALAVCLAAMLAACASPLRTMQLPARSAELVDTPFHPQPIYQCGPAALATVLGASQVVVTPAAVEPLVYLPGRKGSLQVEMQAAPRQFGRIPYRVDQALSAITAEIDAGRPVLVLHNYGLSFWPRWHYAVVVGYDTARDRIIMRSGVTRREEWSSRHFMRAWDNAARWAIVTLRPGELPAMADRARYLEAAASFEKLATPPDALQAFQAATARWPEDPVGWTGRGTAHYRQKAFAEAARDYRSALERDPTLAGARNNLAMALLEMGCATQAHAELDRIDAGTLGGAVQAAIEDTRREITARSGDAACREPSP